MSVVLDENEPILFERMNHVPPSGWRKKHFFSSNRTKGRTCHYQIDVHRLAWCHRATILLNRKSDLIDFKFRIAIAIHERKN